MINMKIFCILSQIIMDMLDLVTKLEAVLLILSSINKDK